MPQNAYAYHKRWTHERRQGLLRTTDAGPARAHVQALMDAGWSQRSIADAAGVGPTTLNHLMERRVARVKHPTATALLAVTEHSIRARSNPLGFVLRVGARRRIQALLAIGHRHADITAAMRRHGNGCRVPSHLVLSQRGEWLARMTHDAVSAAYEEMSMQPGASLRTRTRAVKSGFLPPLAWEEETIDNPLAEPVEPDASDELDDVAVERIMAGTLRIAPHAQSEERREAIRRLAASGYNDSQIGERLGMTGTAVGYTRIRHDIQPGVRRSKAVAS